MQRLTMECGEPGEGCREALVFCIPSQFICIVQHRNALKYNQRFCDVNQWMTKCLMLCVMKSSKCQLKICKTKKTRHLKA